MARRCPCLYCWVYCQENYPIHQMLRMCRSIIVADDNHVILPVHIYSRCPSNFRLISFKSYGKLIVPSSSLAKVVKVIDRSLRKMMPNWSSFNHNLLLTLKGDVLIETKNSSFESLR